MMSPTLYQKVNSPIRTVNLKLICPSVQGAIPGCFCALTFFILASPLYRQKIDALLTLNKSEILCVYVSAL